MTFKSFSHLTVMHQVRRQVLPHLLQTAETDEKARDELLNFLTFEPAVPTEHIRGQLQDASFFQRCFGVQPRIISIYENPYPRLMSWKPRYLRIYFREFCLYTFTRFLHRCLHRVIKIEDTYSTFLMHKSPESIAKDNNG